MDMVHKLRMRLPGRRGAAALLAIITLLLLSVIGAALVTISITEVDTSANFRDGVAAQYLAEAGARRAIVELSTNAAWTGVTEELGTLPTRGRYTVSVTASGRDRIITSKAQVNKAQRQVVLTLTLPSRTGASVYDYAIFSGGSMDVNNNAKVLGSVGSNNSIYIKNNGYVFKDAVSHTYVAARKNADVGGEIKYPPDAAVPLKELPVWDSTKYKGAGYPPSNLTGGTYYVQGDYIVTNNAIVSGTGTIYVTGNVLIDNLSKITGNIVIIADGNIKLDQQAVVNRAVLIAGGSILFNENAAFTGCAVAKDTVLADNKAIITYDETLVNNMPLPSDGSFSALKIISWKNY